MKRILGITMLLALTIPVWSQTSGNPFDLKFRPVKPPVTTPVKTPEIKPDSTITGKTSVTISPTIPPKDTAISFSTSPAVDTSSVNKDNPFELKEGKDSGAIGAVNPVDAPTEKDISKNSPEPVFKKKSSKGFQIFFVLLSLLFLIFIVNVERSFVRDLWRVISNENYSSLHHRNQRNTMRQILLLMGYTVFVLQTGLFLYYALVIFNHRETPLDNIWTCIALVLGIYLTRHGIIRYLRWLFNNDKEMTLFGFDISIFNTMVGLVLLPINILLIFGPDSIYKPLIIIGIITIVVAYLLRQLRWILSARQLITHSLFLFFVYLCAVEILPLWAISKLFW
jgi:Domain of unknown function (DUF4271)